MVEVVDSKVLQTNTLSHSRNYEYLANEKSFLAFEIKILFFVVEEKKKHENYLVN